MSVLIYLLKVNLALAAFYAFYWVFLRRNTFFQANRFYLLLSVVVSFLMPFLKIRHNYTFSQRLPYTLNELPTESIKEVAYHPILEQNPMLTFHWMDVLSIIYAVGSLFFTIKFITALVRIYLLLNESEPIGKPETRSGRDYWLLKTNKAFSSYSFFNFLILNRDDARNNHDIITDHEEVHISEGHSWDIFLIELVHVFCWFNPLLIAYKNSLRRLHEFIADSIVEGDDKLPYAEFLFEYNFRMNASSLGNDFFRDSLLKERIKMMMKKRSPLWLAGKYVFIMPLLVCVAYLVVAQDVRRVKDNELTPAEFRGGQPAFESYFASEFKYPDGEQLEGDVYVSFMVSKDGGISDVVLDKGIRADYNGKVAQVLKAMPMWIPAVKRKQVVESRVFMRLTLGKPNGITASTKSEDYAFEGVIVIDGEVKDYVQKLYQSDYRHLLSKYKKVEDDATTSVRLAGENQTLISQYGAKAANGVDFWMFEKQMLVIYNGQVLEHPNGNVLKVQDSTIELLAPKDATAIYGEKARDGAILVTDNF